jgi:hypothetical protein
MKAIGEVQESRASMWITMFARFGSGTFSAGKWTSLRPYGGSIKALVIDPQNARTPYAGTLVSGVQTYGRRESRDAVNAGLFPCSPRSAAIDPRNPDTVYAAIDEAYLRNRFLKNP